MQSFRHAGAGIGATLATQANARIQLLVALLVVGLGSLLDLSAGDWCWLVVAIAMVFAAECMNTALESLADASMPEAHPLVGRAKDAAVARTLFLLRWQLRQQSRASSWTFAIGNSNPK